MSEAQRIADSLSEAQRRAILAAQDMHSNHGGYPFFTVDYTEPWTEPVAQFLTLCSDRLTPLGLEVKAYLQQKEPLK